MSLNVYGISFHTKHPEDAYFVFNNIHSNIADLIFSNKTCLVKKEILQELLREVIFKKNNKNIFKNVLEHRGISKPQFFEKYYNLGFNKKNVLNFIEELWDKEYKKDIKDEFIVSNIGNDYYCSFSSKKVFNKVLIYFNMRYAISIGFWAENKPIYKNVSVQNHSDALEPHFDNVEEKEKYLELWSDIFKEQRYLKVPVFDDGQYTNIQNILDDHTDFCNGIDLLDLAIKSTIDEFYKEELMEYDYNEISQSKKENELFLTQIESKEKEMRKEIRELYELIRN